MAKEKIFESRVDIIKYKVLRELARQTWAGRDAFMAFNDIANAVVKKGEPPSRCCIYKDRAVMEARTPYRLWTSPVMNAQSPGTS